MSHPIELFARRRPPSVSPPRHDGVVKARRLERVQDRRSGREAGPVKRRDARESLFQNPETTRGHVARRDDDPMRNPGDLAQSRRIVPEMMEHHDNHREIKCICAEREPATIAPHTLEPAFWAGDSEHGHLRIESDNGIRVGKELGETPGSRPNVEDALPIPQASHLDAPAKPELAVSRLVGANSVVFRGTPGVVYHQTSCKREAANEAA